MEEEQQEAPKGADQPDIRDDTLDTEEMKKLFVGGIVNDSTEDELKEFFEGLCCDCEIKVTDAVVIKKEGSEKKAHFGFVTFACSEMIDEVLLKRKELSFKGRTMDVNRAVPKDHNNPGAHERTKKLFIANLPKFNCTEEELKKYFDDRHPKKYGVIDSVQLIKKKGENGEKLEENKGYGFIMVSCEDLADKMAIQHNSFEFGGRRIELKKSVPSSEGGGQKRGGRGRGGQRGDAFAYGGGYGGGYPPYGGGWDGYGYGAFDYGYGGYGADPYAFAGQQQQGGRGGRGGRGGARYAPY